MIGAFAYLMVRTMRNRVVTMARRLKQPRYAIGFVIVIAYFGFLIVGGLTGATRSPQRTDVFQSDVARAVVPVVLALFLLFNWLGSSALGALAFSPAETTMLFSAPVTRRALILLKIVRAQLPILFNVFIIRALWGGKSAGLLGVLGALGLYTMFATMQLHRMGAALVISSAVKYGKAGIKRNWPSYVVALVLLVAIGLVMAEMRSAALSVNSDASAMLKPMTDALSMPWVHAMLTPFALISAPIFARTAAEWITAFAGAFAMLALHLLWVLRSQTAFEEAAAEEGAKLHAMIESLRRRGMVAQAAPSSGKRLTIPLRPMGHPAVAIVWKNSLAFIRTFRPTTWLLVMAAPAIVGVMFRDKGATAFAAVAIVSIMLAFMLLLAGGMTARNDLRGDLLNMSSLKTMPLRGRTIVLAEVASSALPLALIQCALLWIAVGALQLSKKPMPVGLVLTLVVTLPVAVASLNLLTSTIRNGIAVLFPAWTRLGDDAGSGGVEVMGQAMLGLSAMLLGFIVLMIVPALATFVIVTFLHPPAVVALLSSVILGAGATLGESYLVMIWLGRVLERTEPSASLTSS